MPKFGDSENIMTLVEEGDYVFCVVDFKQGLSTGGRTSGCEKYELKLELEGVNSFVKENLIDSPNTAWKIDCFLKSAGVKLVKDEAFEFREDAALANQVRWVNPIGLRGHCRVIVETYEKKSDDVGKPTGKSNKVQVFYTDKPKLAPKVVDETDVPF